MTLILPPCFGNWQGVRGRVKCDRACIFRSLARGKGYNFWSCAFLVKRWQEERGQYNENALSCLWCALHAVSWCAPCSLVQCAALSREYSSSELCMLLSSRCTSHAVFVAFSDTALMTSVCCLQSSLFVRTGLHFIDFDPAGLHFICCEMQCQCQGTADSMGVNALFAYWNNG